MDTIASLLPQRILILDGAMGTMIQQYNLEEADFRGERFADVPGQLKGNNDLLCLTRPDVISDIHRKYLEAGADIIETNSFSSTTVSMADYHVEAYVSEMNLAAARLARTIADEYTRRTPSKPRFVAGSVGPTNKTCSMSPDVNNPAYRALSFDTLADAYEQQMEALLKGGVDALLIETIFDTLNAKAAIVAAERAMAATGINVPIMLSVTISDIAGRTLSGQTLDAFLASVQHANILSVGLNCSFGARQLKPFLEQLAKKAPYYISAYPNAGLPNSLGKYDQTPEQMAAEVSEYVSEGLVNIIGGCCGTSNEYIARYPAIVEGAKPHNPAEQPTNLWLSGLELLEAKPESNFINVGERCNVAGSRKFLRLIKEKNYSEALDIARRQVEDGALVLDINMDDGLLDARVEMETFLNLIASEPEISRVPIMIDSSSPS
jgi:5-methyltetrahydrofolate--homocysteine methyltransferase